MRLNFKSFLDKLNIKPTTKNEKMEFNGVCKEASSEEILEFAKNGKDITYRLYTKNGTLDIGVSIDGKSCLFAKDVNDSFLKAFSKMMKSENRGLI